MLRFWTSGSPTATVDGTDDKDLREVDRGIEGLENDSVGRGLALP